MMLRNNRLLWTLSAFAAIYWTLGAFLPGAQMTTLASGLLLFGGLTTLRQYGPVAWRIVFYKLRNDAIPEGYGAHLAVLGTTLLALGCVWSGLANVVWTYYGQPQHWIDWPLFGFGRYMMAGGLMLAHVSPSMTPDGFSVTRSWAVWVALLAALTLGVFLGATLFRPDGPLVVNRPVCDAGLPIKGNVTRRGKVYHAPGSPWYAETVPEECYANEMAALAKGYRPAGDQ